jgi:hypothetical protein
MVEAFHTGLKASDLSSIMVLAGVSGTGKSLLPQAYARLGGLLHLLCAVRPNWDSPQSLLGFFNFVENRFNPTELMRALDQASRKPSDGEGSSNYMHIILLDEMNLAHIELYFSDFLSKLEKRRESPPIWAQASSTVFRWAGICFSSAPSMTTKPPSRSLIKWLTEAMFYISLGPPFFNPELVSPSFLKIQC